jgi:hypothetical protein
VRTDEIRTAFKAKTDLTAELIYLVPDLAYLDLGTVALAIVPKLTNTNRMYYAVSTSYFLDFLRLLLRAQDDVIVGLRIL